MNSLLMHTATKVMVAKVRNFFKLAVASVLMLSFFALPLSAQAATYGSGNYGSGLYGVSSGGGDVTAPVVTNPSPTGAFAVGTTEATLSVSTNESATCRYTTVANTPYGSMTSTFSTTGGTTHSTVVTGLQNDTAYTYYVRCIDASSNATSADTIIAFSINKEAGTRVTGMYIPGTSPYLAPVSTDTTACRPGDLFSVATGARCSTSSGQGTPVQPTSTDFPRSLSLGMSGPDVKLLQQYLNAKGFVVALTGAGSVGKETTYFGPATKAAVAKFQSANKIVPAAGFFGPLTRAFVSTH